jgi:two-component system chemotaxis sensor kinase CheA
MARDPYKYFRTEAAEIVGQLTAGFLELEKRGSDPAVIGRLFRHAHTLKGAARIVKHKELAELAHEIETWLSPLRDGVPPPERFDEPLRLIDLMTAQVAGLTPAAPVTPPAPARAAATPAPANVLPVFTVERSDLTEVLDGLADVQVKLAQLRTLDDLRVLPDRIDQLAREVRRVRGDAEQLQLVPARSLFTSLERLARNAGAAIDLTGHGGEIRIEPQVLAGLHGALVQLVRNAIAHGAEPAENRVAAGKPARMQIRIEIVQHGGLITVRCRDDGRGIDLAAVRRALAYSARTVPALEDVAGLLRLLLQGGVTTAATVTELSGRGVGLDVVREAAHQLGGEVSATTEAGVGTTFALTVPVSLSTMQALIVTSGAQLVALPLASVRRVGKLRAEHLVRTEQTLAFVQDDVSLPYAALHQVIGGARRPATTVVVVDHGAGDELVALGVERILGVKDVVHRATPAGVAIEPIVSGLTIDDEGLPRPVLDPAELGRAIRAAGLETTLEPAPPGAILVIDDSLTTRMLEQSILEAAGYRVELASSAEEGLAKAARDRYALFLVDVEMPGMDGFSFIAHTRARPELADIPAILVTSRNAPDDHRRGVEVGAQGYIIKGDFDQTELLALIARLV